MTWLLIYLVGYAFTLAIIWRGTKGKNFELKSHLGSDTCLFVFFVWPLFWLRFFAECVYMAYTAIIKAFVNGDKQ